MVVAVVIQLVLYAKADWRGGLSWGPRYMTDFMPFLVWMLAPVVDGLRRAARSIFVAAVGVAIAIEAIGALCYSHSLDLPIYAVDRGAEMHGMREAFLWKNAPFVTSWNAGLAPAELLVEMRGAFDAFESGGRKSLEVIAGEEVSATGWALAGHATPWQVGVTIDDHQVSATRDFVDRADVRAALGEASPAGWRVPLDTAGLTPGEHRLTALAWASPRGEPHYLAVRTLTVRSAPAATAATAVAPVEAGRRDAAPREVPADLAASYRRAASLIREHQQPQGYWLTAFTSGTSFHDPHPEMNTYLTALLVDLLRPVSAEAGLDESLQRARTHLTAQIEAGGLVRYHGLPDGPGIGTLGCAITPDTDDTALVWRIAPAADRARLATALSTIERYRTSEGLYRTWLAPRDAYQCLDPGRDPNPADIVIQMHLLQLLAEVSPEKGASLCSSLRPLAGDDRVWVYYAKTPLVPMLRLADLRRAGCALELPEARMRSGIPEQQIWLAVVQLLRDAEAPGGSAPNAAIVRALLRELARDDFALLKASPPLLYHNDLTATVPRYYWSEDAGYALWLRLYDEYEHPRDGRRGG
jgi:hypothetical protein